MIFIQSTITRKVINSDFNVCIAVHQCSRVEVLGFDSQKTLTLKQTEIAQNNLQINKTSIIN